MIGQYHAPGVEARIEHQLLDPQADAIRGIALLEPVGAIVEGRPAGGQFSVEVVGLDRCPRACSGACCSGRDFLRVAVEKVLREQGSVGIELLELLHTVVVDRRAVLDQTRVAIEDGRDVAPVAHAGSDGLGTPTRQQALLGRQTVDLLGEIPGAIIEPFATDDAVVEHGSAKVDFTAGIIGGPDRLPCKCARIFRMHELTRCLVKFGLRAVQLLQRSSDAVAEVFKMHDSVVKARQAVFDQAGSVIEPARNFTPDIRPVWRVCTIGALDQCADTTGVFLQRDRSIVVFGQATGQLSGRIIFIGDPVPTLDASSTWIWVVFLDQFGANAVGKRFRLHDTIVVVRDALRYLSRRVILFRDLLPVLQFAIKPDR